MELYLVRHPTPAIAKGICYGRSDIGLADGHHAEREALIKKLSNVQLSRLYSSPSIRCLQLAEALAAEAHLSAPIVDHRLMELDFGDWELQSWDDLPRAYFDVWVQDYVNLAPPNGESFAGMHRRVVAFLDEVSNTSANAVLVVTHGGVIRCLLAQALGLPLNHTFRFQLDFAGITRLFLSGAELRVDYVNR